MTAEHADSRRHGAAAVAARPIPVRPRIFVLSAIRLLRDGIMAALAGQPTVQVVGASDLAVSPDEIAAAAPDAVLLDICLPGALEISARIRRALPEAKLVALCMAEDEPLVTACARAGVAGFVYPEGSAHEIVMAVHSAVRGELVCSPRTAGILLNQVGAAAPAPAAGCAEEALTPREGEILDLLSEGLSNKEIARRLCIGNATVKNHVHSILGKLGVQRRGEAAAQQRRLSVAATPARHDNAHGANVLGANGHGSRGRSAGASCAGTGARKSARKSAGEPAPSGLVSDGQGSGKQGSTRQESSGEAADGQAGNGRGTPDRPARAG